jgi:hypothetical protein
VQVATAHARQTGTSQVVAECMTSSEQDRFVVGPARGWNPDRSKWVVRAKVRDFDLQLQMVYDTPSRSFRD